MNKPNSIFKKTLIAATVSGLLVAGPVMAGDKHKAEHEKDMTEEAQTYFSNGWKEGKVETAFLFNDELNNFEIDSEVRGDKAILFGKVDSDIKKDLAEEIALSIDGIEKVDNRLEVIPEEEISVKEKLAEERSEFLTAVSDASISAKVKMKFLVNDNLSGMKIDVDTEDKVVTLKGEVSSDTEKELAEAIAGNMDGVTEVKNELTVRHS